MSILYTKPGSIIMAEKHGIYRIGHPVFPRVMFPGARRIYDEGT